MSHELWTAVDEYINATLIPNDPVLEAALRSSAEAGLPHIQVTPSQGKLLNLLARSLNARNILEIGALGGYSTIWLARGLASGGKVITLEAQATHAEVARANYARAGLAGSIELRLGPALRSLPELAQENREPFDLFFLDADKGALAEYFEWALQLSKPGSMIIADNVVRYGEVIDARSKDEDVQGVRRFNERVAREPRVSATEIQTVGSKGYDGFALALVLK